MRRSHWLILAFVASMVCSGDCRPREVDIKNVYPVYRSVKQLENQNRSDAGGTVTEGPKSEKEMQKVNEAREAVFNIESIATVARASSNGPSLPTSAAIGQIIDTVSQMVDSDVRTPPKLKEIIQEKNNENRRDALGGSSTPLPYTFVYEDEVSRVDETSDKTLLTDSSEGKASAIKVKIANDDEGVKGIAIPVVMDETDYETAVPAKKLQKIPDMPKPVKEDKKKSAVTKVYSTTTPSSGLSTWILLSDNRDVTTPSSKKNNKKETNEEKKKPPAAAAAAGATTTTTSITKKPIKIQSTTVKASIAPSTKKTTAKPGQKKQENDASTMSALEAMVKNQRKGQTTTQKPKTNNDSKSGDQRKPADSKKKVTEKLEVAETKNKVEVELPESRVTLPPNLNISGDDKAVSLAGGQNNTESTTENPVEGTTKKKTSSKKKKKNKNRKRKPSSETGVEAKIPQPAVGSQIYNFLSREIVPTVGLGLIGVALTAGLASFLGYNPFVGSSVPLRRTYETHHGYSPNNYYNYNPEYGDGGQSEEVLFREVLSGMPENSRYGLTRTETSYPEAYNGQDQAYDGAKNPAYASATGSMYTAEKEAGNYDATYPQDYSTAYGSGYDAQEEKYSSEVKDKYPVYSRETGTSFVYPETTGVSFSDKTSRVGDDYPTQSSVADKYSKKGSDTIERQPEALYRVAGESDLQYRNGESTIQGVTSQNSWHRIGSPMDAKKPFPHLEPGPRSLDLAKVAADDKKKRVKRATESVIQRISRKRTKKENDVENEIDFEDSDKLSQQNPFEDFSTTTAPPEATKPSALYGETTAKTADAEATTASSPIFESGTDEVKDAAATISPYPTESYETDHEPAAPGSSAVSVLDVLKRLAQFKLRLGLNFLRSTTDMFSRYLDDIQRRVDESFTNTTTTTVQYNRRKSPWSRIFFSRPGDPTYRRRRSLLRDNSFLTAMFAQEDKSPRFSKSTKKDLKPSNKFFHQKKSVPKKYDSKSIN